MLGELRKLGFDVSAPKRPIPGDSTTEAAAAEPQRVVIRLLHHVRFPLHDHCRKEMGWSDSQVLLRFLLIQAFLTPLLMALLVKVR